MQLDLHTHTNRATYKVKYFCIDFCSDSPSFAPHFSGMCVGILAVEVTQIPPKSRPCQSTNHPGHDHAGEFQHASQYLMRLFLSHWMDDEDLQPFRKSQPWDSFYSARWGHLVSRIAHHHRRRIYYPIFAKYLSYLRDESMRDCVEFLNELLRGFV